MSFFTTSAVRRRAPALAYSGGGGGYSAPKRGATARLQPAGALPAGSRAGDAAGEIDDSKFDRF